MSKAKSSMHTTINHQEIRQYVEARGGTPSVISDTGTLQISYPGSASAGAAESVTWDQFFKAFEDNNLAMAYQEETAEGKPSNILKFVQREPGAAGGSLHRTASATKPYDTDDDAMSQPNKDEDGKKKETKGFTARKDNDDDSQDKNPDTKGGKKTNDPAFRGGSDREKGEVKSDKNDNKKSGDEKPNKKSTDAKKKH